MTVALTISAIILFIALVIGMRVMAGSWDRNHVKKLSGSGASLRE
jgi:hypothetical protein